MPPKNKRLMNLIKQNATNTTALRVTAEADEATLYIYDVIDEWWGVSAEMVAEALAGITASTLNVRINSPGGDVFVGRAIQTLLAQHPARVVMHIDGLAASAASFITTAGEEIRIADGAFYMIHKAWTIAWGNSDDMEAAATLLSQIDESLVKTYVTRTGQSADDIRQWMVEETWFNAEDAKENGFVDSITEVTKAPEQASAMARWNLAAYAHAPEPPEPTVNPYQAHRNHLNRKLQLLGA